MFESDDFSNYWETVLRVALPGFRRKLTVFRLYSIFTPNVNQVKGFGAVRVVNSKGIVTPLNSINSRHHDYAISKCNIYKQNLQFLNPRIIAWDKATRWD